MTVTTAGTCHPAFVPLRERFEKNITSGDEVGASLCVTIGDETVVDIWGGHADPDRSKPWSEHTIEPVWSLSKPVSSLGVLLLIDRGLVDPDAPLVSYWPEFAGAGRDDILVRHVLGHTAGLPSWNPPLPPAQLYDLPVAADALARQEPWWTPGTAAGYHPLSQGYLTDALVRRVAGKPLGEFVRDELATPRAADFHFGVPASEWGRIGEMVPPPPLKDMPGPESLVMRVLGGGALPASESATPAFWSAGIPSMGGIGNARSVNRLLSIVARNGTVDGRRFMGEETIDAIFREQSPDKEIVMDMPVRFGMGFALSSPLSLTEEENKTMSWLPAGRVCWWGGWGGSIGLVDMDRQMTITYVMNRMGPGTIGGPRATEYVTAVYELVQAYEASIAL